MKNNVTVESQDCSINTRAIHGGKRVENDGQNLTKPMSAGLDFENTHSSFTDARQLRNMTIDQSEFPWSGTVRRAAMPT
jgi:hypothetical protein